MPTASVPATRPRRQAAARRRVDRIVGEALQMAGGHLTGTLKLLTVVSDRRVLPRRVPRAQLASGYTLPGEA
jgi:hypothetical protein